MEQEDYSKIYEYESMGKEYAGERACISLTSWRERINTVSKTLYSLIKMCPGFHIVLVLSKDEFPLMEKELPDNLMLFVENKLIELFWIKPNLKSFKKVLFTMDKYRDVPVISADDDCVYTCNYAQELYDAWVKDKECIITFESYNKSNENKFYNNNAMIRGPATIYPLNKMLNGLDFLSYENILKTNQDDVFYNVIADIFMIKIKRIKKSLKNIILFHDTINPLFDSYKNNKNTFDTIKKILKVS